MVRKIKPTKNREKKTNF